METIRAAVVKIDEKHYIEIGEQASIIRIPLSEDKPSEVKSAFNQIIERIRKGEFKIELEEIGDDLFSQVSKEYIKQLNREIKEVYGELKQLDLLPDS